MNQGAGVGRRSASARDARVSGDAHSSGDALLSHGARTTIDEVLHAHAQTLGRDFQPYRHHVLRVAAFCMALAPPQQEADEKVALAAAFHDLGIWTHGTFDYLQPSIDQCMAYLAATGRSAWQLELAAMIREHHKLTAYVTDPGWLVEPFRRADWIDVTRGVFSHGLPRGLRARIFSEWPSLGFRRRLLVFTLHRWRQHPLSPLPMLRL
jgi:hypothetical protein